MTASPLGARGVTELAVDLCWPRGSARRRFAEAVEAVAAPELDRMEASVRALRTAVKVATSELSYLPCRVVDFRGDGLDAAELGLFVPGDSLELQGRTANGLSSASSCDLLDPLIAARWDLLPAVEATIRKLRASLTGLPREVGAPDDLVAILRELPLDAMEALAKRCSTGQQQERDGWLLAATKELREIAAAGAAAGATVTSGEEEVSDAGS